MGTSASDSIRVEGVIRAGGRVEVELRVGGAEVARAADGDRLTVATAEGEVAVDASALELDGLPSQTHRSPWSELARRPEAALVAERSPAPHVACELVVRRLGVGAPLAIEAVVTERGFEDGSTHRAGVARRVRAVRAVRLAGAPARARAPEARRRWWILPWTVAGLAALASALVVALAPNAKAALVSISTTVAILVAARFAQRALEAPPAMDHGMANPFPRFFARAARSLPRFAPEARDASRHVASLFGPLVVVGWGYVVFLAALWPIGVLSGEIDATDLAPAGSAWMIAGLAGALTLIAIGYLVADASERPRARALLAALDGAGPWRARRGTIAASSEEDVLRRTLHLESESHSDGTSFSARTYDGGDERVQVLTAEGPIGAPRESLLWASDEWAGARMRVREGMSALVAGFEEGGALVARGPASMMLFASRAEAPDEALRSALRAHGLDSFVAAVAALSVGGAAAMFVAP